MKEFVRVRDLLVENFNKITENENHLFEVELDKDKLWETYLSSFPKGTNPVFRERTEHDCSCCRHFIKQMGNTIIIDDKFNMHTIWEVDTKSAVYQPVFDELNKFVLKNALLNIKVIYDKTIGTKHNSELLDNGKVLNWDHFYLDIPRRFISSKQRSVGDIQNEFRTRQQVFKRSLEEISMEAVDTVLELIAQNSLYRGEEWKGVLTAFKDYKKKYNKVAQKRKDAWCWKMSISAGPVIGRMRNHSIGVLLTDITNGKDLEEAVRSYEYIVAPTNYKRPKAIFTKKMLEEAQKTITELGYMESLNRRFATLDDINVNNILFSNKDAGKRIAGFNVFDELQNQIAVDPNKLFKRVEEVSAEKFVKDVLPLARELEVFVDNRHMSNFMSLIAPQDKDSKTMFKWNNNYSWAYDGNITDSMKERVKEFGGKVDGDLRFSIQWNTEGDDNSDLDAHCIEPSEEEIYYGNKLSRTKGKLDIDITRPISQTKDGIAVENITWNSRRTMDDGTYRFFVHQFAYRNSKGFSAEIEFDGNVYTFEYPHPVRGNVQVAEVTLKDGQFTIKTLLEGGSTVTSKEKWGVNTMTFVPCSVVSYSPNYWDEQKGTGNQHLFFFLKGCINPNNPRGIFNEYLKPELEKHKRVFEALGAKLKVEDCNDQLSGLGFSLTQRNELLVKVIGATTKIVKIKF